ncbi:MAG TPA: SHOCT domain-containing protein, partial [Gemmataceae bacterium]|nr:SHOCT domain-containing protein [Gemmataceae bacterium]
MSMGEELQKLHQLHQSGALSEEEFAKAKARLLENRSAAANREAALPAVEPTDPQTLDRDARQWAVL